MVKKKRKMSSTVVYKNSKTEINKKNISEKKRKTSKYPLKNNSSTNKKLDVIISKLSAIEQSQKVIINKENIIQKEEDALIKDEETAINLEKLEVNEEQKIELNEKKEVDELKKIEDLEQNIKDSIKESPLKRITYRDITKGIIGAFFGIVGHFAFVEGTHLSAEFSILRSTLLLVTSFIIILLFLYFSGFRKVNDKFVFEFLPIRAVVIFVSAITTVILVLLLYGMIGAETTFTHMYNSVSAISILAVLGAGTADLIGKNE